MKHESTTKVLENQLINDYQIGDFFLASPEGTLLGKGCFATVPRDNEKDNQLETLAERISKVLENSKKQGHDNPIVVGAVPFDYKKNAQLIVPKTIKLSSPLQFKSISPLKLSNNATYGIKSEPEPTQYIEAVEKAINYIESGHLNKIVLARSLTLLHLKQ